MALSSSVSLRGDFFACSLTTTAGRARGRITTPGRRSFQVLDMAPPKAAGKAKKVIGIVKLALESGKATPAPPVGPALGSKGVNVMAFCKEYNAKTADNGVASSGRVHFSSSRVRSLVSTLRCLSSDESAAAPASAPGGGGAAAATPPPRPLPWLFVGLGNPGKKYEGTRHNVGFQMIDVLAQAEGITLNTVQFKAVLGKGKIGGAPVLLAKPQTYMNLSGESVKPLASYYKIPPERVLTIYDDLDLEFAVMKLLAKGGHGGHNGMKSVLQHIGNRNTARMRIGIGRPPGSMDPQAFVLQKFSAREHEELAYALDRGVQAIQLITTDGLEKAVSTWNQVRKSKVAKMSYSDLKVD